MRTLCLCICLDLITAFGVGRSRVLRLRTITSVVSKVSPQVLTCGISEAEHNAISASLEKVLTKMKAPSAQMRWFGNDPVSFGVHGALGRVCIVVGINERDEETFFERSSIAFDGLLAKGNLKQPVAIIVKKQLKEPYSTKSFAAAMKKYVGEYSIAAELRDKSSDSTPAATQPPTICHIDGAFEPDEKSNGFRWDVSRIAVFDGLVDDRLRQGLLSLLHSDEWDPNSGPDPSIWEPGALDDVPSQKSNRKRVSWGLTSDSLELICDDETPFAAVVDFEEKLMSLFPRYQVSRLPSAVLGESVNAC